MEEDLKLIQIIQSQIKISQIDNKKNILLIS